jgi:hypothetical protein
MKTNDISPVEGIFTYREINKATGEIEYEYIDNNVVTEQGINTLFLRAVLADTNADMTLDHFVLGNDTGNEENPGQGYGVLNPKPAEKSYTILNQFSVYEVPKTDMVLDYPDANTLQAGTLLDGKYILDTFFPGEVDLQYTSATFRFSNNTAFSYKRFPVRSLSRLIDLQIIWSFRFTNSYTYVCPVPDLDSVRYTYVTQSDLSVVRFDENLQRFDVTTPSVIGIKATPEGKLYYISTGRRLVRLDENLVSEVDRLIAAPGDIRFFDIDRQGNVYCVVDNNNGLVIKLTPAGDVVWSVSVGSNTHISSISVIDDNRLAVSTEDTTDFAVTTTKNKVWVINSLTSSIMYNTTFDNGQGSSGYLTPFGTSGGELFVIQRGQNSSSTSNIIKVAFDLSELSRTVLVGRPVSFVSVHNNEFVISTQDTNTTKRFDADLNEQWSINTRYDYLSTDREQFIYAGTDSTVDRLNPAGTVDSTATTQSPISQLSSVGEKWSFFS